jgi:hypothetical protein
MSKNERRVALDMDSEVNQKEREISLALLFVVHKHDRNVVLYLIDFAALLACQSVLLRLVIEITLAFWAAENIEKFFAQHHVSCRVW